MDWPPSMLAVLSIGAFAFGLFVARVSGGDNVSLGAGGITLAAAIYVLTLHEHSRRGD